MRSSSHAYCLTILLLFSFKIGFAKQLPQPFLLHSDFPFINSGGKLLFDVFYVSDTDFEGGLFFALYKFSSATDSTLVLSRQDHGIRFGVGQNKIRTDFSKGDTNLFVERKFYEVLRRTGSIAPGPYKTYILVNSAGRTFSNVYQYNIDSLLGNGSSVRKDLNKNLRSKKQGSFQRTKAANAAHKASASNAGRTFIQARKKIDKTAIKHGLTSVQTQGNSVSYTDLYFEDWFAGRYEVKNKGSLFEQVEQMEGKARIGDIGGAARSELGDPSLFSQFKTLISNAKDQNDITGLVSLTTNTATGQEPNSGMSNNYYEVSGSVEVPVSGIPMELDGLYTSQDENRSVKSSYIRLHYDAQKMKAKLAKSISAYNTKFATTVSKAGGMEKVYGGSIANMEEEKRKLINSVEQQEALAKDTSWLMKSLGDGGGSKAVERRKKTEETYARIAEIEKKIARYNQLLEQHRNTKYFDSSLVYDKTKNIGDHGDLSYKQMARMGANMLPDGKAKKFLSGVTAIDAGMFYKNGSKYTMAGQMVKGAGVGYDLGFCEINLTAGKTQFAGRSGGIDKYTCYASKTTFKAGEHGRAGITYYGYSVDRNILSRDIFFEKVDVAAPSFLEPVHIVSADYTGSISKYVTIEGEAASSFRNAERKTVQQVPLEERMAYHFSAEGNVPGSYVNVGLGYDKTGKGFENSTLPMQMAGTEQYKVTARNDFFHSRVSAGVEFNRLVQSNLASNSNNTKWGFDIKTAFKKYPNIRLSYKPYTTFRSLSDTLAVPQRPLFGAVWMGNATYQVKRKTTSWRFSLIYTQSTTVIDTAKYGNSTLQANCVYTGKRMTNMLSAGHIEVTGGNAVLSLAKPGRTKFIGLATSYMLNKVLSLTNGEEIGFASFGACRYAVSAGLLMRPKKAPYTVRLAAKYNTYKLEEGGTWSRIFSGCVDLTYRFKKSIR